MHMLIPEVTSTESHNGVIAKKPRDELNGILKNLEFWSTCYKMCARLLWENYIGKKQRFMDIERYTVSRMLRGYMCYMYWRHQLSEKLNCRFNPIPVKCPTEYFMRLDKLILKFAWKWGERKEFRHTWWKIIKQKVLLNQILRPNTE